MSRYDKLAEKATPRPWVWWTNGFDAGFTSEKAVTAGKPWSGMVAGGEPSEGYMESDDPNFELIVALVNAAPDIAALWKAADRWCGSVGHNGHDERQDDGECEACQLRNAVEALRPLFGEE